MSKFINPKNSCYTIIRHDKKAVGEAYLLYKKKDDKYIIAISYFRSEPYSTCCTFNGGEYEFMALAAWKAAVDAISGDYSIRELDEKYS